MSSAFDLARPNKVLFPNEGITKRDIATYYKRIAARLLPHVSGRPVTLHRYPDGLGGASFYQKNVAGIVPGWANTVEIEKRGGTLQQLIIDRVEALELLVDLGCITAHVWLSRIDHLRRPDRLIFDLDPSVEHTFALVKRGARALSDALEAFGLVPFVMTTGSRGLHVTVPIRPQVPFDAVRLFARAVAECVVARAPRAFTLEQRRAKRGDRVYIDIQRNAYAQTSVAPYAVRARPGAPVAMPLAWNELSRSDLTPRRYTIRNVFRRMARIEDPWRSIDRFARALPPVPW